MGRANGSGGRASGALEARERGLEHFFALSRELLCVIHGGRFVRVSSAWDRCLGWPEHELLGRRCVELIHPDDLPRTVDEGVFVQRAELTEFENRVRHRDGSYRWLAWNACTGADDHVYAVARDVTDARRREDALRASDERYRVLADLGLSALEGMPLDELMDRAVSVVADTLGVELAELLELLPNREALVLRSGVGWREGAVGTAVTPFSSELHAGFTFGSLGQVVVPDFSKEPRFQPAPLLREHGVAAGASVILGGRGRPFGVLGAYTTSPRHFPSDEVNFLQAVANVLGDAVAREQTEAQMRHQALHDPLTGLPNRTLLLDRIQQWRERARRHGGWAALMFVDLDRFKVVNDGLGHDAGDALLVRVASRLASTVRAGDTVARLGGDEFMILCEDVTGDREAQDTAERVMASLEAPFALQGHRRQVTASIGVVVADAARDLDALMQDADEAMYRAKARGRDRWEMFDQAMRERSRNRLELERDLRVAVGKHELYNAYQPIVSMNRSIVGFEALVRWDHPVRGPISPSEFIPVAEHTGLIVDIGRTVLTAACRQAANWLREGLLAEDGYMNVNLSPRQVTDPSLLATVADVLAETGLDPRRLCLEITESVLLDDAGAALDALTRLKALGPRLVLDDFGTGYSSLSHIKSFPIDVVKIDRSFIDGLERSSEDAAIVTAVISMGEALGVSVVAEGVETTAQARALQELGCHLAQGYLYSRPLDPGAAAQALLAR